MSANASLKVDFDGEHLSIVIGKNVLIHAMSIEKRYGGEFNIVNEDLFLNDIVKELSYEEEDGTTVVHEMLDKAINSAIENGSYGVEIS